jgi:hypothetical protein
MRRLGCSSAVGRGRSPVLLDVDPGPTLGDVAGRAGGTEVVVFVVAHFALLAFNAKGEP